MTNDAKLGLLAGLAGVVTAGVFHRPAAEPAAPPAHAVVAAQPSPPPRVAGAVPPPHSAAAGRRPDIDARPVSRVAADDE